jgi:tetratricopeptide (TPR) repeat protein
MSYEYQAGGSLPLDAPSYIKRQADDDFFHGLLQGEFCYVLNARQMGKSSLRVRTIERLRAAGVACASIDITEIGSKEVTLEQWYAGLIDIIAETIKLTDFDTDSWWDSHRSLSPVHHFAKFIDEILLVQIQQPIVIFIDETDAISRFGEDFFALIRSCYNKRPDNPAYQRLTFAILGVVSPTDLIADKKRTPFNIGRAIELTGFQFEEARILAQGLPAADPEAVLRLILDWTGGQPFLTQKLCRQISQTPTPIPAGQESSWVAAWVQNHIINHWEGKDEPPHLKHIRDRILHEGGQSTSRLLGLYQQLLHTGELAADDSREQVELRFSGLVVRRDNQLFIYNKIYAQVFDLAWVEKTLAELRPYAPNLRAWEVSGFTDNSRLLQGQALQEAQKWAKGKSLGDADHQFLMASSEQAFALEKQANQVKMQRRTIWGLFIFILITASLVIWGYLVQQYAVQQEELTLGATNALAHGLLLMNHELKFHELYGDMQSQLGDTEKALQAYQKALNISQKLAKSDPTNVLVQRNLSESYEKIGNVQLQLGGTEKALQAYQQALEIRQALAESDPTNVLAQRDLSVSFNNLGDVQLRLGDTEKALQAYQQDLNLASVGRIRPHQCQRTARFVGEFQQSWRRAVAIG